MKKLITITIVFFCSFVAFAETRENRKENPHEIRIGIADDLFLRGFENITTNDFKLPTPPKGYRQTGFQDHNYRSTGHLYIEYHYRINHWLSVGANFDTRTSLWKRTDYSICALESITSTRDQYTLGLTLMPTVRFSYYNTPYASFYASVGVGTYMRMYENYIETILPVLDVCYFGVSLGKNHWFCDLELGGAPIPFLLDRLFRFNIGYRF
ncbi:MAG: hypothetical protein IKV26_09140 [Paludibacteraceae bacterium]|nr:hypothetical protein [Paludibacteraceae bacterium]